MTSFLIMLAATALLIALCSAALMIGKLLTGKDRFTCRRCSAPEKRSDCLCKKSAKEK